VSSAAPQRVVSHPRPLSGSAGVQYRTWAPSQSSIEIEYSDDLIREVRLTSLLGNASGVLYGTRNGNCIRLAASRRALGQGGFEGDPGLAGLDPIGTFFARPRGQVFLTESDLERFERSDGAVALVVAGTRAGFFVYEADGSIETIKSQGEFFVPEIAPLARAVEPPKFVLEPSRPGGWVWMVPVAVAAMALVLITQSYWQRRPAIGLTAQDQAGQLRIRWNPDAASDPAGVTLQIADGGAHMSIPISTEFASATYVRRTWDVQIHLTAGGRTETVRFFGAEIAPSQADLVRQQVNQLESEANALDGELERGSRRIARLKDTISSLLHAP
jgi:hypothetical protein